MKYLKILGSILILFLLINITGCININKLIENNTAIKEEKSDYKPIDDPIDESYNHSANKPSNDPINEPCNESTNEPINEPCDKSVNEYYDNSTDESTNKFIVDLDNDEKSFINKIQEYISEIIGCDLVFNGTCNNPPILNPYGYSFSLDTFYEFEIKNPVKNDWEVVFYYNIDKDSLYMNLLKPYENEGNYLGDYERTILLKCYENSFTIVSGSDGSIAWSLVNLYPEDVNEIEVIVNDIISTYNGIGEFITYGELPIKYPYFIEAESQEEAQLISGLTNYEKINLYDIKSQISKAINCEPVYLGVCYTVEESYDFYEDTFYKFEIKNPIIDDWKILFYYNINQDILYMHLLDPYEGAVKYEFEYSRTLLLQAYKNDFILLSGTDEVFAWSLEENPNPAISKGDIKVIVDEIISSYNGNGELIY